MISNQTHLHVLICLPGAVEVGVDLGELEEAALVDGGAHGLLRREIVVHAVHLA